MALSDVAAGVEVTTEQREHGVAVADATGTGLVSRLEPFAGELPCDPATVATIVRARVVQGETIAASAHEAGVAPMTARKALYLVGEPAASFETGVDEAVAGWLDDDDSWAEASAGIDDRAAFALAAYTATHDPIPGASRAVADALSDREGTDALADARSDVDDLV